MNKFNYRKFVNYASLFSFLILASTGLILYVTPHGSYSRWTDWSFLLMSKDHLEGIHSVFSFVFLFFIIWHLVYQTRVFIRYLKDSLSRKKSAPFRELFLSVSLILVIFTGSYLFLPPFSSVIRWGESLKRSWERGVPSPPISDFESYPLSYIAQEVFAVPVEQLVDILQNHSLSSVDPDRTIRELSVKNNLSPKDLYLILKKGLASPQSAPR